jgi:hypothetical protein
MERKREIEFAFSAVSGDNSAIIAHSISVSNRAIFQVEFVTQSAAWEAERERVEGA